MWQVRQGILGVVLVLLFGVWLRWPTLENGYFSDDISAMAMAEGAYAAPRAKLDLFDFTNGTPEDHTLLMRAGSLPWWTAPGLRLAMLRPLSSALMLLDRALFGDHAVFCHVHSFLWWLGAMWMAATLLRELFSPALSTLALFLFALEEGQTLPLGWLANRGTLVAMVFCLAGLRAHLRYRREGNRRAAWLSFACFSVGLLSGEWAFPLLGYVLGYQLFADRAPLRARAFALWPAAIPGLVFLVCRSTLGFGALHSGVYTDPLTEPARFLVMCSQRLPVFFADLVFAIPSHWWGFNTPWREQLLALELFQPQVWLRLPNWHVWHVTLGALAMLSALAALRYGLRNRSERERFELRWLLAGASISLLPMVSSFPTSRLVLPAALACAAAAAALLLSAAERLRTAYAAGAGRRLHGLWNLPALRAALLLGAVVYFQVWQAGWKSFNEARWSRDNYESVRRFMQDAEIDDARIASQRMVIVSGIEHTTTIFAPYLRWFFGHPMPRATFTLSAAPYAHDVYRPAANVLELGVLGGTLLSSELEELYRAPRFKLQQGQEIDLGALRAKILRLIDGRPQQVRFTFDASVDDPSFLFLYASPEGLVRAHLPEIGQTIRYRRPAFPSLGYNLAMRAARDPNVACVGPRPAIDDCRLGFFFADCGGDAAPVLGCRLNNDCRWFLHGCVAQDYETSSCNPARTCCIPNAKRGPAGSWPFAQTSFMTERPFSDQLAQNLSAWGEHGFHVELPLPVQIEPHVPARTPYVRCSGIEGDPGPCDAGLLDFGAPGWSSLYFTFRSPRAKPTWALSVELVDTRAAELTARVCRVPVAAVPAEGACTAVREPVCATAGRVVINAFPVEAIRMPLVSGWVVAEFADGAHVEAEF